MILLLYGGNELALRRRLQELREQADGGSGMLLTNLAMVEGREARPADILGPAMSPPFLAPHRLVLVEGFLDRFEQRRDQRAPRSIEPFQPLFAGLEAGMPGSTMLVFTGGAVAGRSNAMVERLKKVPGTEVEEHGELKGADLMRFIRGEAEIRGIRFRNGPFRKNRPENEDVARMGDPVAVLATLLQSDTLAIANELDKLALYTMGRDVTVDETVESCGAARQFGDFAFGDAILDGDLRMALEVKDQQLLRGGSVQELLATLFAAYRPLATVVEMLDDGASAEEIGKAIRRPWPGLRDRAIQRARTLGHAGLRKAYAALIAADRGIKSGEVDEDLALEVAITQLCAMARPGIPARR